MINFDSNLSNIVLLSCPSCGCIVGFALVSHCHSKVYIKSHIKEGFVQPVYIVYILTRVVSSSEAFTLAYHIYVALYIALGVVLWRRHASIMKPRLSFGHVYRSAIDSATSTFILASSVTSYRGARFRNTPLRDSIGAVTDFQDFELFDIHGTVNT